MVKILDNPSIKRNFTIKQIYILTNILNNLQENRKTNLTEICKKIKEPKSRVSPIINYLKKIKIINEIETIGNIKLIEIVNFGDLVDLIAEQEITDFLGEEYFKKYHSLRWINRFKYY